MNFTTRFVFSGTHVIEIIKSNDILTASRRYGRMMTKIRVDYKQLRFYKNNFGFIE